MDALTRENRYEGKYPLDVGTDIISENGHVHTVQRGIYVTHCRSCGSLVPEGSEELHERMHPRVGCMQVHATAVYHPGGHAWEEQFR